jgi:ADP-ribosylglycohydrolase
MKSSGWVVDTLECALWAFFKYDTWKDGALAQALLQSRMSKREHGDRVEELLLRLAYKTVSGQVTVL